METLIPKTKLLQSIPSYLQAAIYASAGHFRRYDPVWSVSSVNNEFPETELWDFAHRGILKHMSSPNLSVLQALLIYLQRPLNDASTSASYERPGQWALLGSATNIATQLGLHLDCTDWSIPDWEKRLRRRLWWITYSEATWRCLLLGLPHPIHNDQWDVSELTDADFLMDHIRCPAEETATQDPAFQKPCAYCHSGHDFCFLAQLAVIANNVNKSMYTISATKKRSQEFGSCLADGRDLLEQLRTWQSSLPEHMSTTFASDPNDRDYFHSGSSSHLKLSSLTLEMLIYRALLRPTGKGQADQGGPCPQQASNEDIAKCFRESLHLVRKASSFAQSLTPYDLNSFSYSCRYLFLTLFSTHMQYHSHWTLLNYSCRVAIMLFGFVKLHFASSGPISYVK